MAKLAQHMTRIVAIGKLDSYEYDDEASFRVGKGVLDLANGTKARFTIFNKDKEGVTNPHTKAKDFAAQYSQGDLVYITGSDNRSYSEAKDQYYEDIQVWDFRDASEEEMKRWVFVYVADVKEFTEDGLVLSYINYKNEEMVFPINTEKSGIPAGLEVGDRVKVKGTVFSGRVEDFYGDGEFKTFRTAAEIKLENTKAEIEAESQPADSEKDLW